MTRILAACAGLLLFCGGFAAAFAEDAGCAGGTRGPVVQVLGSGGPVPDVQRASSGYLIWLDGHSRVLIDAGGGTFVRFSESGARLDDLWFVGLSHLHTDHSAELPAFLKGAYFSERTTTLPVSGPRSSRLFPGLVEFIDALFAEGRGAYRYLSGYLTGKERFRIDPLEIDHTDEQVHIGFESAALKIHALGVPHGIVPALAYRLELAGKSVVFAGDQNGSSEAFIDFARATDLLVMHMAIPENATSGARQLHAPPSRIGRIAEESGADVLLLSHFMSRSIAEMETSLALIREHFAGKIILAQDLLCIAVSDEGGPGGDADQRPAPPLGGT